MKNSKPKVSVVTITYAHEKYIEDTLRGVLMQQYDGPIEFIIANDNSPDQTDEVVKKFFDTHPIPENIEIKYTRHSNNVGVSKNFIWAIEQASGKYVALCEGDDYWTDPLKLSKQVNLLEDNNNYVIVSGGFKSLDVISNASKNVINNYQSNRNSFEFSLGNFFDMQWPVKTLTVMFRRSVLDIALLKKYETTLDIHLNYHLLEKGIGFYSKQIFGIYRIHENGIYSSQKQEKKAYMHYKLCKDFYKKTKTTFVKRLYFQTCIDYGKYDFKVGLNSIILISSILDMKIYLSSLFRRIICS